MIVPSFSTFVPSGASRVAHRHESSPAANSPHCVFTSARVETDRETNRPRGFGFVEMANQAEAQAAIGGLNGSDLHGRTLTVNESKPREDRGQGNRRSGYAAPRGRW